MTLLTATEFKALHKVQLTDAAVESLLAAAEADIDERWGPLGVDIIQEFFPQRPQQLLQLRWPVDSISSIVERVWSEDVTLDPTDYRLSADGGLLERVWLDAEHPRGMWGRRVTVTYQQKDNTPSRKRVQAQMVVLDARYQGRESHSTGDEAESFADYTTQRRDILNSLFPARLRIG